MGQEFGKNLLSGSALGSLIETDGGAGIVRERDAGTARVWLGIFFSSWSLRSFPCDLSLRTSLGFLIAWWP